MEATIQVKIKMAKGKEITLDQKEAKELFLKLKEIYDNPEKITYVPYYPHVQPLIWYNTKPYTPYWTTTCGTATITYSADNNLNTNTDTVTIK
jgi:hypothetical protein